MLILIQSILINFNLYCDNNNNNEMITGTGNEICAEIPRRKTFETGRRSGQRALATDGNIGRRPIGHRFVPNQSRNCSRNEQERRCGGQRRGLRGGQCCHVLPAVDVGILQLCDQSAHCGARSAHPSRRTAENVQLAHLSVGAGRRSTASRRPQDHIQQESGAGFS